MKIHSIIAVFLVLFMTGPVWGSAKPIPNPPSLKASSYLLMDFDSGRVLAEDNADEKLPPASLTKMMTAYLVDKAIADGDISLDDIVTVSKKAWQMKGSLMFIEVGEQVSVEDLLKGLIIQSGNDASVALAEHIAGSESAFVGYMNHQAQLLGMTNTNFMNATGWPHPEHYSTARDLAILAQAMIRDFPESYRLYKEKTFKYNDISQPNRNKLLRRDESVDGIKTGHTEAAGYCLVASAKRGEMRLISSLMGAPSEDSRFESSQSILNYGFRFYETHQLYQANEVLKTSRIWYGQQEQISMGVDREIHITIPRGRYKDLDASMEIDSEISAPIARGQQLGQVNIKLDDEIIVSEDIVAMQSVEQGSLFVRALDSIKLLFR